MNVLSNINGSNGSSLTEAFKVKVKRGAGWQDHSICRLHISVGQDYHEGQKFRATMEWAKENFDHVIICVNDTLQRHNRLFEGKAPEAALEISKQAGREWVQRNTTPEERTSRNISVFRWQDWLEQPNYEETLAAVKAEYEEGGTVKNVIDNEVKSFWERVKTRQKLGSDFGFAKFNDHSREYLLEECAVFSMMFQRDDAADIYPGSTLVPCQLYKDPSDRRSRNFTRIDFSRIKGNAEGAECVRLPESEARRILSERGYSKFATV
jgi:tRNA-dependent cyclodipeptide synthase